MTRCKLVRAFTVAAVACAGPLTSSCSGPKDPAPTTTVVDSRPLGSELANRLGCDRTGDGGTHLPGSLEPATDCFVNERFLARLESVDPDSIPAALDRLAGRYTSPVVPCDDGTQPGPPWIVVGYDWIAVAQAQDDADTVLATLGGELNEDSGAVGPVTSYVLPDC